jgi:hypothetical protein
MSTHTPLIEIVEQALLQGAHRDQLDRAVAQYAEKNALPPFDAAAINAAYADCLNRWIIAADESEAQITAYHVRIRKHLYQKSHVLNDFKTCLAIQKDLADIQGKYRKDRPQKTQRPPRRNPLIATK